MRDREPINSAPHAAPSPRPGWSQALALAAVRFYQVALRPLNPWGCKFHPSCSHYALEAIERHGLAGGTRLAVARLLRCRPGVFGGYDPVPLDFRPPGRSGRSGHPERSRRVPEPPAAAPFPDDTLEQPSG